MRGTYKSHGFGSQWYFAMTSLADSPHLDLHFCVSARSRQHPEKDLHRLAKKSAGGLLLDLVHAKVVMIMIRAVILWLDGMLLK